MYENPYHIIHIIQSMITSVSCLMLLASVAHTLSEPQFLSLESYTFEEKPLIFDIDGAFFAIFKSHEHFQYLSCLSRGTHVALFDPKQKYKDHIDQLWQMSNNISTRIDWKYLAQENDLYEWFLWKLESHTVHLHTSMA